MELRAVAKIISQAARQPVEDPTENPPGSDPGAPSGSSAPYQTKGNPESVFLDNLAACNIPGERLASERRRCLAEISVLRSENRWEDILALFHPVEEKMPELDAAGLATAVRSEMAFALSRVDRFEESMALYQTCIDAEPDSFHFHAGLAYTAYNSLYAAKTRRIALHPAERKSRIERAHKHFVLAQTLRPEGVTNYYRQGMLYKQIQGMKDKALPLFETAVHHWRSYSDEMKKLRHQERKNYIKALYHLASCKLDGGTPGKALELIQVCLREDESSGHISVVHKYFALGKTHFQLGHLEQAKHALQMAAAQSKPDEDDYVFELMARTHLAQGEHEKAWEAINRVPLQKRRPYVRWTEADVLLAQGNPDQAARVLREAAERDRRGRHKALIRLARLEFGRQRYAESLKAAKQANDFFQNNYQNQNHDALFWEAAALLRLQRPQESHQRAMELSTLRPGYPHLAKLKEILRTTLPELGSK